MKARYLLPPALALVVSASWLGLQHAKISDLDENVQMLTKRIDLHESTPVSGPRVGGVQEKVDPARKFYHEDGEFNWLVIGKAISEANEGMPADIADFVKLQQRLLAMSVSEVKAALAQIEGEKLSNESKENLVSVLVRVFAEKDPVGVLAHFKGRLNEGRGPLTWQLTSAFEKWLELDSEAALAWFDARKRAGSFEAKALDPKMGVGRLFEVRLLGKLMKSDIPAVQARLEGLPVEERKELLKLAAMTTQGKGISENYLTILREQLPEEERYEALADAFGQQVYSGKLPPLQEQLSQVSLSEREQEVIVEKIVENFANPWSRDPADLAAIYAWADREAPGQAPQLTGETFAHYAGHRNTDFTKTFREVLKAVESKKEPAILEHFMNSLEDPQRHLEGLGDSDLQATYRELVEALPASDDQ